MAAVSYTHLDVYKRQGLPFLKMAAEMTGGGLSITSQPGRGTVSYTHLDVYKRQQYGSAK